MDWDHLRYVLALSRNGTLSAAADELDVTHTTVARRIAAIETTLATRVFERIGGRYVPTAAGEQVARVAADMEEALHALDRGIAGRDQQLHGRVRLATTDILALWMQQDLTSFSRRYPEVDLELLTSDAFHSLDRREADVALRATNTPPDHLVGRRLGRIEYAVYANHELLASHGTRVLSDLPWLGIVERMGARLTAQRRESVAPGARVVCRIDGGVAALSAVRGGMCVGFLPCLVADPFPELVRLRPVEEDFGLDLWVLTHPDLRGTARVRALMQHLGECVGARRHELEGVFTDPV